MVQGMAPLHASMGLDLHRETCRCIKHMFAQVVPCMPQRYHAGSASATSQDRCLFPSDSWERVAVLAVRVTLLQVPFTCGTWRTVAGR